MSAALEFDDSPVQRRIYDSLVCEISGDCSDPRYTDAFIDIKAEIDKLTGIDTESVVENSLKILSTVAKDLRVITYMLSAFYYARNVPALCEIFDAIPVVLEKYGDSLYPKSKSAQVNSVHWLNSPKHTGLIARHYSSLVADDVQTLDNALGKANTALGTHIRDEVYISCFDEVLREAKAREEKALREAEQASSTVTELNTDINEKKTCYALADYYLHSRNLEAAINISRTYRWATISDITHENNVTRIPEPRTGLLNDLEILEDPVEIIIKIEHLFREPGAQFLIMLQKIQYEAAERAGLKQVADVIFHNLSRLMDRNRDFRLLKYASGKPFICSQAEGWLNNLQNTGQMTSAVLVDDAESNDIENASTIRREKGLSAAIQYLEALSCTDISRSLRRDLCLYEMVRADSSLDVAMTVLNRLYREILSTCASLWDKELVAKVIMYIRDVKNRDEYGLPDDREINNLLCDIGISTAISLTK
jgi:type VI secretion system protein VasJ